ncbi:LysE family translocator [Uliginosibacterium sp. sgz301328]|uniref:LysE family translocator n=1 Tax=Uliginosibacterium sp. sgz301328 TaxID=3243764 RepID=UPI00359E8473
MTPDQLALFVPFAFMLAIAPGPDNLAVLALGVSNGRPAALGFGLGCAAGCLNHTLLAAIGVSALIAASPVAFAVLQYAGAAYLVWLGIRILRSPGSALSARAPDSQTRFGVQFRRGLLANAINPKVGLFFLALLPQFVRADGWAAPWQILVLGVIFGVVSGIVFSAVALGAAGIGQWLARHPRAARWTDHASALVFIGLGIRLALGELPRAAR